MDEYTIIIASDEKHEQVFAEIYHNEKFVAVISQEDGIEKLKIEFPSADLDESMIERTVNMEAFRGVLASAVERLKRAFP